LPTPLLSRDVLEKTAEIVRREVERGARYPLAEAAKELGVSKRAVKHRLDGARDRFGIETPITERARPIPKTSPELEMPEQEQDYEVLAGNKARKFANTRAFEDVRKLISVKLPYKGNCIGVLFFGDLHLDDDGCDFQLAREHAQLVRGQEGCYGLLVGDILNNWIGGLAKKYAEQSTTLAEAHVLASGFIGKDLKDQLLAVIGGNHDEWGGLKYFLDKIARDAGTRYIDSAAGLSLKFPSGNSVRIRVAHQLPGNSIYHSSQGQVRDMTFRYRWELTVSGHIHKSGYITIKQEDTEVISHGIQVASYEVYNAYAREKQMKDCHIAPCAFVTINGTLPNTHPDMIKVFWDPFEGVEYLKVLQKKHG